MAKVTNAFTTYGAKGNREDLANAIYNIDPTDRPFMTAVGTRNATNVQFDWQTETLPAVNKANRKEEGFELSRSVAQPTVRRSNICQISTRDATVSGSQESADAAGKRGEMAHQIALNGKALLRDMESILVGEQARANGDDTTPAARATRAFEHWITTNASYGAGGANPASETAAVTDGTLRAFTEALLADAIQETYENGGEPTLLMMGPYAKRKFSGFAGRANSRVKIDADEIVAAADFYLSDFGELKAVPSRWQRPRTVLGIDPEYAKVAYYRRLKTEEIAKIGDAETRMLVAEYGLEVSNEAAHFKIADIAPSAADEP
ncbi:DUF5309 domain-containing protein [Roseomonas hellenica]|uniref:DUF5309 domain-containing protein n=1 Tax=Plastoroseomonas hellenica TaxID=2687306 RepID=A0ABS5F9A1_9PROT|nr:DUF5309 family protein [Plastoroseomonas hellenica]MBR0669141.1 DUF5309 domain-containing protein [Plastoroseomonas hellenica]